MRRVSWLQMVSGDCKLFQWKIIDPIVLSMITADRIQEFWLVCSDCARLVAGSRRQEARRSGRHVARR